MGALDTSKKKTADLLSLALCTCPTFNLICVFDISETSLLSISEQISIVNKIKFHKSHATRTIVMNTKGESYDETLNLNVIDLIKKELAFTDGSEKRLIAKASSPEVVKHILEID